MNRSIRHDHHCQECGVKTPCSGELFQNWDGEPEICCRDFHLDHGINRDFVCEGCEWKREDRAIEDRMENV
jgi:hypothetical protein